MSFNESRKILADLKKFESQLPAVVSEMGAIGQNHFVKSFQKQGFENVTLEKWKPRKDTRMDRGKPNRAILVKSGALRRSIRRVAIGKYGYNIVSDMPYAKIHNDGGLINKDFNRKILSFNRDNKFVSQKTRKGRNMTTYQQQVTINAHSIRMPKRQFMGYSRNMNSKIERMIDKYVKLVFK